MKTIQNHFVFVRCHNIVIGGKGDSDCTSEMNGVPWCYIIGKFMWSNQKSLDFYIVA